MNACSEITLIRTFLFKTVYRICRNPDNCDSSKKLLCCEIERENQFCLFLLREYGTVLFASDSAMQCLVGVLIQNWQCIFKIRSYLLLHTIKNKLSTHMQLATFNWISPAKLVVIRAANTQIHRGTQFDGLPTCDRCEPAEFVGLINLVSAIHVPH